MKTETTPKKELNFFNEVEVFKKRIKKRFPKYKGFIIALNFSPTGKIVISDGDKKGLKAMIRRHGYEN